MSNTLPLRVYNGNEWVNIGVQSGQVLYQNEEPSSPQTGSIWIDSDDETSVLNGNDFLTINSASAIYAPSASPTFSGQVNLPATTNYDGNLLSATLGSKLDADTPSFLSDQSNTTQTGAADSNFVYATCEITLTSGTWMVQGQASIINTTTGDTAAVGLWNETTSAEISNSRGVAGLTNVGVSQNVISRLVPITVSSNTVIRLLCTRNGSSTIRAIADAGGPAACLNAFRVAK